MERLSQLLNTTLDFGESARLRRWRLLSGFGTRDIVAKYALRRSHVTKSSSSLTAIGSNITCSDESKPILTIRRFMKVMHAAALCFLFSITAWGQDQPASTIPAVPPGSGQTAPATVHPGAITYSDGYQMRAKIHKIASFATLPLFASEVVLGQSLYNDPSSADSRKGAHIAVGTGIIGLFGVNAVTGVWNMVEDRHNPSGHKLRLAHGILMLAANAGFVATAATGPHGQEGGRFRPATPASSSDRSLHRDLAFVSIGVGTIGYTLMLFGHH